jgi:hypothetical protein
MVAEGFTFLGIGNWGMGHGGLGMGREADKETGVQRNILNS